MQCHTCGASTRGLNFCDHCGARIMSPPPPPSFTATAQPAAPLSPTEPPLTYAGFWYRALALVIDFILFQIIQALPAVLLGIAVAASMEGTATEKEITETVQGIAMILALFLYWIYFAVSESSPWQATLGKKMLGLKVTDQEGRRLTFARATGRHWARILSGLFFGVGYVMAAFSPQKKALHDEIAKTFVLRPTLHTPPAPAAAPRPPEMNAYERASML